MVMRDPLGAARPEGEGLAGWRVPLVLREFVRADEIWLVLLAAGIGIISALCVAAMVASIQVVHHALFAIDGYEVSGAAHIDPWRAAVVPVVGGLLLGFVSLLVARRAKIAVIDPIEANALRGGSIPFPGSVLLVLQTMISNGCGASIGMEAGYTQIGAALVWRLAIAYALCGKPL